MRISGKKSRRPLQGEIQKKEWVKRIRKEKMRMKKLFDYAAKYFDISYWKDLAMIKLCLFSIGILAGMRIPQKNRKQAGYAAAAVFAVTYIPLMAKFVAVVMDKEE